MSDHRRVGVVFAWQAVLLAVITLSCTPTQELEPAGMQPGCGVVMPAELTAGSDKTKKPKKPKKPKRAHPSQTPCDFGQTTTLDLLVMYDTALLQLDTEEAIVQLLQLRVSIRGIHELIELSFVDGNDEDVPLAFRLQHAPEAFGESSYGDEEPQAATTEAALDLLAQGVHLLRIDGARPDLAFTKEVLRLGLLPEWGGP